MLASSVLPAKLAGLGLALPALVGCTLRYQTVHEANVWFEHCYRVDEEPLLSKGEKLQCWRDWSHKHAYGQTRDRIEYSFARQRALGQAPTSGERTAAPGTGSILRDGSPQPTSALAPPAQMMTQAASPAADAPRRASLVETNAAYGAAPGATCSGACGKVWVTCGAQCKGNGCQSGCDDRYRACMRGCF